MTSVLGTEYLSSLGVTRGETASSRSRLDQTDFLNLMVTQFRNQDPLKPVDADVMLGQLAQFGTVTGLAEVKSQIGKLAEVLTPDQSLRATALVGRQVLVPSSSVQLGAGGDARLAVQVPANATAVAAQVLDSAGRLVSSIDLGPRSAGLVRFAWDGVGPGGDRLPPGTYTLQAQATIDSRATALETLAGATVAGVALGGSTGAVALDLGTLGEVGLDMVRAVYD
jgi:flagellar basal-body rod modification protein FlgD